MHSGEVPTRAHVTRWKDVVGTVVPRRPLSEMGSRVSLQAVNKTRELSCLLACLSHHANAPMRLLAEVSPPVRGRGGPWSFDTKSPRRPISDRRSHGLVECVAFSKRLSAAYGRSLFKECRRYMSAPIRSDSHARVERSEPLSRMDWSIPCHGLRVSAIRGTTSCGTQARNPQVRSTQETCLRVRLRDRLPMHSPKCFLRAQIAHRSNLSRESAKYRTKSTFIKRQTQGVHMAAR